MKKKNIFFYDQKKWIVLVLTRFDCDYDVNESIAATKKKTCCAIYKQFFFFICSSFLLILDDENISHTMWVHFERKINEITEIY